VRSTAARLGARRDYRHEVIALANLLADLLIPGVAAAELALVEPDVEAKARQCIAYGPCGLAVIGGITQENGRRHKRIPERLR